MCDKLLIEPLLFYIRRERREKKKISRKEGRKKVNLLLPDFSNKERR